MKFDPRGLLPSSATQHLQATQQLPALLRSLRTHARLAGALALVEGRAQDAEVTGRSGGEFWAKSGNDPAFATP